MAARITSERGTTTPYQTYKKEIGIPFGGSQNPYQTVSIRFFEILLPEIDLKVLNSKGLVMELYL